MVTNTSKSSRNGKISLEISTRAHCTPRCSNSFPSPCFKRGKAARLTGTGDVGEDDVLQEYGEVELDPPRRQLPLDHLLRGAQGQHGGLVQLPPVRVARLLHL